MSEKKFEGRQFQQNEAAPNPEKSKLEGIYARDLVPPRLKEILGDFSPNIVVHKNGDEIDFVIHGNEILDTSDPEKSRRYFHDAFRYFTSDTFQEEYPELMVEEGKFYRPLVRVVIGEKSPDIFFVYTLEVRSDLRGKGVGAAFEEHFDQLAKQLGFKFHASHQNDAETARYFLQHGRYLLAEIRDDKKEEFRPMRDPDDEEVYQTIKFLNPEDVNEYVRPERIGTDVEDKIRYMESQIANFREK